MNLQDRVEAFRKLGEKIKALSEEEVDLLAEKAGQSNAWFTRESIKNALEGISFMLEDEKLKKWIADYSLGKKLTKIVGIVMAGNIPLVGFHDLLCVLMTGHFAAIKPSSDDQFLTSTLVDWIQEIEPRLKKNIEIRERLNNTDAVIATGSDNTARYFEYYFKDIPHVIRKNRTSVAVLDGNESEDEIRNLGIDIFSYFGLGCRNVSKIFTPKGLDLRKYFPHFETFNSIIHHHKYRNNYDYHKSIYLVNKTPHLDTGFLLTVSAEDLVSPISVLYHQEYDNTETLSKVLKSNEDKIQCIVGNGYLPFGSAQSPELWDYADNLDTIKFLAEL
ncbi:MAG: acyl-CoA reductase [Cyclobacteriaceae bacterium]